MDLPQTKRVNALVMRAFAHPLMVVVVSLLGLVMLVSDFPWTSPGAFRTGVWSAMFCLPALFYQRWAMMRWPDFHADYYLVQGWGRAARMGNEFLIGVPVMVYLVGLILLSPRLHVSVFAVVSAAALLSFVCYPQQAEIYRIVCRKMAEAEAAAQPTLSDVQE